MTEVQRMRIMFFGSKEERNNLAAMTGLSVGEFLYDYLMIDPLAVEGMHFSRTEDLSHLFTLSEFAQTVDLSENTGDIAQLQGYVAERMIGAELQRQGHDVTFPETSNQAGYDLNVDGQTFQLKNLADAAGVRLHLEKYPDIPVYVNSELAHSFEGNEMVYVTNISHSDVVSATKTSLEHASNLNDFQIPYVTFIVYGISDIGKIWRKEESIEKAVINTLTNSTSKIVFASAGKVIGTVTGSILFGPQFALLSGAAGTILFGSQSFRASEFSKRKLAHREEQQLREATYEFLSPIRESVEEKKEIKREKLSLFKKNKEKSFANELLTNHMEQYINRDIDYMTYKQKQIEDAIFSMSYGADPLEKSKILIKNLPKTGIHPVRFQEQFKNLTDAFQELKKKL